jgi:hypothetical protein
MGTKGNSRNHGNQWNQGNSRNHGNPWNQPWKPVESGKLKKEPGKPMWNQGNPWNFN